MGENSLFGENRVPNQTEFFMRSNKMKGYWAINDTFHHICRDLRIEHSCHHLSSRNEIMIIYNLSLTWMYWILMWIICSLLKMVQNTIHCLCMLMGTRESQHEGLSTNSGASTLGPCKESSKLHFHALNSLLSIFHKRKKKKEKRKKFVVQMTVSLQRVQVCVYVLV